MDISNFFLISAVIFGFLMAWGIGANDVSNAMGTSVGSGAITIRQAIIIAAIFEFIGALLAGSDVTNTIKSNIISPEHFVNNPNILALGMLSSLLAAATWLLLASLYGWPVSTTHTIVGAIVGFGINYSGLSSIAWSKVTTILLWWILSPIVGGVISFLLFISIQKWIFLKRKPFLAAQKFVPIYIFFTVCLLSFISFNKTEHFGLSDITFIKNTLYAVLVATIVSYIARYFIRKMKFDPNADRKFHYTNVERIFSVLMVFTACAMAFGHGSNDVANAIGPVAAIVSISKTTAGEIVNQSNQVPIWILLLGASGIVVGLAMYGHKVIATVGSKITQLTPSKGFCATMAAATTVVFASMTGYPISTTHTLVGGILGVGLARGIAALNMNVIRGILLSWVITLPVGAILCIIFFHFFQLFLGLQ